MPILIQEPSVQDVSEIDTMTDSMNAMDLVHKTGKAFFEALAGWDGEELKADIIRDLLDNQSVETRAALAIEALMRGALPGGLEPRWTQDDKLLALEVAEYVGQDGAQWLYHFAKLVTKLT